MYTNETDDEKYEFTTPVNRRLSKILEITPQLYDEPFEWDIQTNITHIITYLINAAFFYVFYNYTNKLPSYEFIFYLFILVCFDIYSLFNLSIVFYILSQAVIMISLLVYYFPLMPKFIQKSLYKIIFFVSIIILLFLNEKYNCKKMMYIYPNFPYHVFIEIIGIVLFYIISSNFYKL